MTGALTARDDQELSTGRGIGRDVAVVGAGAVGAGAAYELARRGADVTLYDRGPVANGASGRAAGFCYDAVATEPAATLARTAVHRFRTLSGPDTFSFQECPYVWFAREGDEENAAAIQSGLDRMTEHGVAVCRIDASTLSQRFPALRTDDVTVAGVTGGAGYADPGAYTACLAENAAVEGATVETHTPVGLGLDPPRVVPDGGSPREVDAVLVAAGAHSKRLLDGVGVPIAMKPYRVQALVAAATVDGPMWYDATAGCYARPHPDGLLAGDGTEDVEADPERYDRDADPGFGASLCDRLRGRLPGLRPEVSRAWAGLCTATPDRQPLLGRLREGLYVATGFQGQGFMRAPATGRLIAEQMLGGPGIDAFDPTRFSGDEEFGIREGMSVADA
jgi:sarcosine oxidase subunit beta